MVSFATVEKIDDDVIKLHLEMYPELCESHAHRKWRKTYTIYDSLKYVKRFIPDVREGDVLAVEHCGNCIISYIEKDDEEKERRINHLKSIFRRFHH